MLHVRNEKMFVEFVGARARGIMRSEKQQEETTIQQYRLFTTFCYSMSRHSIDRVMGFGGTFL